MDWYTLSWIFFIYAFLGWCTEVSFAALKTGRFVNRGFLNGPVCPIYGVGVAIVVTCLAPLRHNSLLLFLGSVVLTSLLELLTGAALEGLFHQRWWDYSNEPFNLKGYICLRFSLGWGLACLLVNEVIHPPVLWLIHHIPRGPGWVLLAVLGAAMAVDLAATVRSVLRLNARLRQIQELLERLDRLSQDLEVPDSLRSASQEAGELIDSLAGRMRSASDELGENLAQRVGAAAQRGEAIHRELEERRGDLRENLAQAREERAQAAQEAKERLAQLLRPGHRDQRRLLKAFPSLRSSDCREALERLRELLKG